MTLNLRKFLVFACLCGCTGPTFAEGPEAEFVIIGQPMQEMPQVLFWDQMTTQQRARLWPLLTHEQRLFQWRYMNQEERRLMRRNMTPGERTAIKKRFVIDRAPDEAVIVSRKMTPAERDLLRRQVIQVHFEMRRGVPYNCQDPTNCPRSAFKTREVESVTVSAPVTAAPADPVAGQEPQ